MPTLKFFSAQIQKKNLNKPNFEIFSMNIAVNKKKSYADRPYLIFLAMLVETKNIFYALYHILTSQK